MERVTIGGTHAPPITVGQIDEYRKVIGALEERRLRVILTQLLNLVCDWYTLPDSNTVPKDHPSGRCKVVGLSAEITEILKEKIPFKEELKMFAEVLEQQNGLVRNIGYHLLWYATELSLGREPITLDKLT